MGLTNLKNAPGDLSLDHKPYEVRKRRETISTTKNTLMALNYLELEDKNISF